MTKQVRSLTVFVMGAFLFWAGAATRSATASPVQNRSSDVTRTEIENFDVFLDGHAAIARQLRSNPSLVNNEEYVENHPALQKYLENHPNLREELQENPGAFVRQSERFEGSEARRPSGDHDRDFSRANAAGFDMFLDNHPDIARQLTNNPSLADNPKYLRHHPALQQFLQAHPNVRAELRENPQAVLRTPPALESQESQGDVAGFEAFLDQHPQVSRQLSRNPSLVRNEDYLEDHPALQQFLQTHPQLRAELAENPQALMQAERQFDNREAVRSDEPERTVAKDELATFDAFLDAHPRVAEELSRNPSLVNNEEFEENHPELQKLLNQNPEIQQHLKQNPQVFVNATVRTENQRMVRPQSKPLHPSSVKQ